jgi:hypothetical protein
MMQKKREENIKELPKLCHFVAKQARYHHVDPSYEISREKM